MLEAVPPAKRKLSSRARWSWAAIALLVLIGGGALIADPADQQRRQPGRRQGRRRRRQEHGRAASRSTRSATDYDPQGDGEEDPETVELAIDGNPTGTAWSTEHYDTDTFAGTKTGPDPGVGLYVTAEGAGDAGDDGHHHPDPGLGRADLRRRRRAARRITEWGEPVGEVKDAEKAEEVELHLRPPPNTS